MIDFIKRQFCRVGLHRWGEWECSIGADYQYKFCDWCGFEKRKMLIKYSITEILMEFAQRK